MLQFIKKLLCVFLCGLMLVAGSTQAMAFALGGQLDTWQTATTGFLLPPTGPITDIYGSANLGEEYRWNSPVIVYAFDPSFLNYFGQEGVDAVERAIKILNDLPKFSSMSKELTEFPLDTRRFNFQATALGIRDMKSWTLSTLLEALGLTSAERAIFTIRSRVVLPSGTPVYAVVRRNFDPVTLEPSNYVNGTLYTYTATQTYAMPDAWEAVEVTVDPLAPSLTAVSSLVAVAGGMTTDFRGAGILFNPGLFYTGLTRDDVGGLRYIYRQSNLNVENVATNAISAVGGSVGGGLPWLPAPGSTAAAQQGGATAGGGAAGGAAGGVGGGVPGGVTATNVIVDIALRPGPDKITFRRVNFDSTLGQTFTNSVTFTDQYITNGVTREQLVTRPLTAPDILFTATDLGVDFGGFPITFNRTIGFQNNSALNGTTGLGVGANGPGVIGTVEISFSKIGPFLMNIPEGDELAASRGTVWGSFDGSTNAPIIFPRGMSVQELERIVTQQSGGRPWRIQGTQ
jgi:hypothetical protein